MEQDIHTDISWLNILFEPVFSRILPQFSQHDLLAQLQLDPLCWRSEPAAAQEPAVVVTG
jgi:hypothetical protein